jgi:serine/threonine protein kinase
MYTIGEKIGSGGYSDVYKCLDRVGNPYCLKMLPKAKNTRSRVQHEVSMMKLLSGCIRVPRLIDVVENEDNFCLVQELCKGGNLTEYVNMRIHKFQDNVYAESTVSSIIRGAVRSLLQVHNVGIIHRDAKHGNFIMADTSEDAMVKICDFGISIYCDFDYVEVKEIQGTPTFMAPENLAMKYSYKSDVWSIGVMTYHLLHS